MADKRISQTFTVSISYTGSKTVTDDVKQCIGEQVEDLLLRHGGKTADYEVSVSHLSTVVESLPESN